MKNITKICAVLMAFLLIGITNVKAAGDPIIIEAYDNLGTTITELDLGSVIYNTSEHKSFKITNTSGSEIAITNVAIDTDKFSMTITPASTVTANDSTTIQFSNAKGVDVTNSPLTANVTITIDDSIDVVIPIKVMITKADPTNPTYLQENEAGKTLSQLALTGSFDWDWEYPDTVLLEGDNYYSIKYTDTTGNYNSVTKDILITGLKTYYVTMPTDENVWTGRGKGFTVLDGYSASVIVNAGSGIIITSLTINGAEQLTAPTDKFEAILNNVTEDIVIETVSERTTIIFPMEDPITNEIVPPIHIEGTDGSVELKFDFNFADFRIMELLVDGIELSYEDIMKYFKFSEGSVVIEMTNEYLNTLDVGTHTLEIVSYDGELLTGTFIIEAVPEPEPTPIPNPETGDNILIYASMVGISIIGIVGTIVLKKIKHKA